MAPQNHPSWFESWLTPQPLFNLPGLRFAHGPGDDGGAKLGHRFQQCPSLWLATEDRLHARTHDLLDFIRWDFDFDRRGPWGKQRSWLEELFRLFFRTTCDLPAWLSVVPVRKPLEFRLAVTRRRQPAPRPEIGPPIMRGRERNMRRLRADLGHDVGEVSMGSLLFGYRPDERFGKASLIQVNRRRLIPDARGGQGEAFDTIVYLAQEGVDDTTKGHVPAIDAFHDEKRGLNLTPSVMLAKLTPREPWIVRQLIVTFCPDGRIAALAPGQRSFGTFLDQYPLEATLLIYASVSKPNG